MEWELNSGVENIVLPAQTPPPGSLEKKIVNTRKQLDTKFVFTKDIPGNAMAHGLLIRT